jgi:uncharacterized protein YkwD
MCNLFGLLALCDVLKHCSLAASAKLNATTIDATAAAAANSHAGDLTSASAHDHTTVPAQLLLSLLL